MNYNRILQGDLEASSGFLLNRAGLPGQGRARQGRGYLEARRVQD